VSQWPRQDQVTSVLRARHELFYRIANTGICHGLAVAPCNVQPGQVRCRGAWSSATRRLQSHRPAHEKRGPNWSPYFRDSQYRTLKSPASSAPHHRRAPRLPDGSPLGLAVAICIRFMQHIRHGTVQDPIAYLHGRAGSAAMSENRRNGVTPFRPRVYCVCRRNADQFRDDPLSEVTKRHTGNGAARCCRPWPLRTPTLPRIAGQILPHLRNSESSSSSMERAI